METEDGQGKVGKFIGDVFKGAGILAVLAVGYTALTDPDIQTSFMNAIHSTAGEPKPRPSHDRPNPQPDQRQATGNDMKLDVSTGVFKGCALDPTAIGCPLKIIQILNRGNPVRIERVVINKRSDDPHCNVKIGKTLNLGDIWSSEGVETGESMFAYDFTRYCGDEAVNVEVVTDRGPLEFEFRG